MAVPEKEAKSQQSDKINILYVFADSPMEWNCSEWRCLAPSNALNRAGHKARLLHVSTFVDFLHPEVQDAVAPADLIIFQRNLIREEAWDAIRYWSGMGKVIAADLDDAYQILPWSNPAHRFWIENSPSLDPDPVQALERGLGLVDGLIAPNQLLLRDWEHVLPGFYLPNYARREWWSDLPQRERLKRQRGLEGKVIIGWGGSVSHYDSWWGSGIREALTGIVERFDNVMVLICGNDPRIFKQLPIPNHRKLYQRGVPPQEWPEAVRCFDIGVAPLFGPYDQRRSWIKGLEYLLAGVPWIATQGEPYREISGLGLLIPNGAGSWYRALERLLLDLPRFQDEALKRVELAQQWFVDRQVERIVKVYRQIRFRGRARKGMMPGLVRAPAGEPDFAPLLPPWAHIKVQDIDGTAAELGALQEGLMRMSLGIGEGHEYRGVPLGRCLSYDFLQVASEGVFVKWLSSKNRS